MSRWHGYHGTTLGALALSGNKKRREDYRSLLAPECVNVRKISVSEDWVEIYEMASNLLAFGETRHCENTTVSLFAASVKKGVGRPDATPYARTVGRIEPLETRPVWLSP